MGVWESLRIALRALGRNKMRTGLTMLGMIIGVGAVITMVALGAGATERVTASISSLGTNLLTITPGSPRLRFGPGMGGGTGPVTTLTEADAKAIADHFPQTVAAVAPIVRGGVTTKIGDKSYETSVTGTTPDYRVITETPVSRGRFISQADVDGRLKVAVLGTTVIEQLLGSPDANPIGMYVQINRVPFRVVGVLKTKGAGGFGQDQDDIVIVPVSTALRRVFNRDYLSAINVEAVTKETMDLAIEQMSRLLRQRHHLLPPFPDNDDFSVRSQTGLLETLQTATGTMTSLLAGIAVVSLIVGGIGIMNIMLVSVSERTREIGLRKAVGATSRDILLQFLIESCVIAVVGGMIGVALGAGGARLLGRLFQTTSIVTMQSVLEAVIVAAAVGIFFGIYPAQKASRLNPIEALRFE
jgi:putative ABC transport system permease protein